MRLCSGERSIPLRVRTCWRARGLSPEPAGHARHAGPGRRSHPYRCGGSPGSFQLRHHRDEQSFQNFKRANRPQGEIAATARDLTSTKITLEDELTSILPNEYEALAIPSDRSSEGLAQGELQEGVPASPKAAHTIRDFVRIPRFWQSFATFRGQRAPVHLRPRSTTSTACITQGLSATSACPQSGSRLLPHLELVQRRRKVIPIYELEPYPASSEGTVASIPSITGVSCWAADQGDGN